MFKKAKNFAIKKMVQSQLKDAPPEQQEMIMAMVEKEPELFQKIAKEIKAEQDKGASQTAAAMKVMPKYSAQIQRAMGPEQLQKMAAARGGSAGKFNPDGSVRN